MKTKLSKITKALGKPFQWGLLGRISTKNKIIYSVVLVVVVLASFRFYLWGKFFADVEPADGVITNQVTAAYLDDLGRQHTIVSNKITSPKINLPPIHTNPEYTFSKAGWYMISIPGELATADPKTFFKYGQNGGIDIDEGLIRMDTPTQALQTWNVINPLSFKPLSSGEAYWVQIDETEAGAKVINTGSEITTPRVVSLATSKAKGWALIGNPFNKKLNVSTQVAFTSAATPNTKLSFAQAAERGWIDSIMYSWDNNVQGLIDTCPEAYWCQTEEIQPWSGAWLRFLRNDLSIELLP